MKLSTAVKPISYLKANGEAKVVVQDIRSYERMLETLALLKILTRSKQNMKRGKVKTLDNTFTSLEKRIKAFKNERI
jgi:hypothetical protein